MPKSTVEIFLEQHMGLDIQSVGSTMIAQSVKQRMAACRLDESAYETHLRTSPEEQKALVEAVVVLETWFFRNHTAFEYLAEYVKQNWRGAKPLRVLSIPCATGEEAYSAAMTLLDGGLNSNDFAIDAYDICDNALTVARQGVYGNVSFRGQIALKYRDRYFESMERAAHALAETRYRIRGEIQNAIRFRQGNILHAKSFTDTEYDVVFCRNLLIYLTPDARRQAFVNLEQAMAENGLLFLGHAERSMACEYGFQQVPKAGVFACRWPGYSSTTVQTERAHPAVETRKAAPSPPRAARGLQPRAERLHGTETFRPGLQTQTRPRYGTETRRSGLQTQTDATVEEGEDLLEQARQLADQGRLQEALARCEEYLRRKPDHAPANFLLGVVYQAMDQNFQAENYFNKTLYLDPNHQEALSHLLFLVEKRGQAQHAARLRQRLQRLRERESV